MIVTNRHRILTTIIAVPALLLFGLMLTSAAHVVTTAPITVCSNGCDYTTIQDAVNAASDGGTILVASGIYTENVDVTRTVTIRGQGPLRTTVDGNAVDSVFTIPSGAVITLTDMTITNGSGAPCFGGDSICGGGIFNEGTVNIVNTYIVTNTAITGGGICSYVGTVNVTNSRLSSNSADCGGGIFTGSTVNITNSIVISNTTSANGGGIRTDSDALVSLVNSTVMSNSAPNGGGGGIFSAGVLTLANSTVNGNLAFNGGGIMNFPSKAVTLINSTVSGNTATDSYGGGISNGSGSILTIINSTVSNNLAGYKGGGVSNWDGTVITENAILAGNNSRYACPDCFGVISSSGYNLVGNTSGCTFTLMTGDITNINPLLSLLQDNGGPTWTHALLPGSPAIDAGNPAGCTDHLGNPMSVDQRGFPQPVDGDANGSAICDIGALESLPVRFASGILSVDEDVGVAMITATLAITHSHTVTVTYSTSDGTALAGSDYIAAGGIMTFAPDITMQTFGVTITNDALDEANETILLSLSSPVNADLGVLSLATLTIVDDDIVIYLPLVFQGG